MLRNVEIAKHTDVLDKFSVILYVRSDRKFDTGQAFKLPEC